MKITAKTDNQIFEATVDIVAKTEKELAEITYALENVDNSIVGNLEGKIYRVNFSEILYFESVDKKTFGYTADKVYEIAKRLSEIEAIMPHEFMRTEKSSIINLARVEFFKRETFGRIVAKLTNGEKVIISQYVTNLKQKLNGGKL